MNHDEIIKLTKEYGGDWGVDHSERLLKLVSLIAGETEYDKDVIWLAAYLHDWGGYAKWITPGVEHYIRSSEVVRVFLSENQFPQAMIDRVIECIEFHHGGNADRSIESKLFTDADALDLLGAIGIARIFAMNSRDIKSGYMWVNKWKERCENAISLEVTKKIAAERLKYMESFLKLFEAESFGIY